jgi:putative DNA primase/helicase
MPRLRPVFGSTRGIVPTSAADLARHLGGKKSGARSWSCRCPAHDDANPSLSVTEADNGKILFHCHAGCSQGAVIDALRDRGLRWQGETIAPSPQLRQIVKQWGKPKSDTAALVKRIWNNATDPAETVAEDYLRARGLILSPELRVFVLRFHPACVWEGGTVPALIAGFRSISDDNALTGIHRVRLDQPGEWPRAERKMLGRVGGSAVKLDPANDFLVIGEGVETCPAARQLALRPVWALGSAGAIAKFPPLVAGVEELTILGENDGGANRQAAEACADIWQPRRVTLLLPTGGHKDFNDTLLMRGN